jgi:hypothetical protein
MSVSVTRSLRKGELRRFMGEYYFSMGRGTPPLYDNSGSPNLRTETIGKNEDFMPGGRAEVSGAGPKIYREEAVIR